MSNTITLTTTARTIPRTVSTSGGVESLIECCNNQSINLTSIDNGIIAANNELDAITLATNGVKTAVLSGTTTLNSTATTTNNKLDTLINLLTPKTVVGFSATNTVNNIELVWFTFDNTTSGTMSILVSGVLTVVPQYTAVTYPPLPNGSTYTLYASGTGFIVYGARYG